MRTSNRLALAVFAVLFVALNVAQAQVVEKPTLSRLPRTNLLVYHNGRGAVMPVKSKSDWQKRRAEIITSFESIAGPLPGREKQSPLKVKIEETVDGGEYERRLITYQSEPGSRVPAYLLIPKSAFDSRKKLTGILCLHPTEMQNGHRVTVEVLNEKYRAYAHDLALRGFVVLAPAYPLMAKYQPDLKALGWKSGTMKAIWDNKRGLDVLDGLSFVKHGSYGAIGHSLGGHNAIYTAVFDERIKAIVSSCGFDSYLDYYGGDPKNWQPGRGWCQDRYLPKLAEYRGRLEEIPYDFPELIGALAPRPFFVNAPVADANFQAASVDRVISAALPVYQLYRAEANVHVEHPPGGHDFPEAIREQAFQFLRDNLK